MEKNEGLVESLLKILVSRKFLDQEKANALKKLFYDRTKSSFVNFLLEKDLVARDDLLSALSEYYQKPSFDVVGHFFEEHLLRMFPEDVLVRKRIIPLERDQNILIVVASEPDDPTLLDTIGKYVSYDVRFQVGIAQDIIDAVREFSSSSVTEYPEELDVNLKPESEIQKKVRDIIFQDEDED